MASLMRVLSTHGVVEAEIPDKKERSVIGAHWNAIQKVLGGDAKAIQDFEGVTVHEPGEKDQERSTTYGLEADPKRISRWAHEHDVEFEDIYAS